jgi:two-component system, cell cycle sensor histidine kinase and response regulator CckA
MSEKRILIVEDERVVAEDLKRLLVKLGYSVVGVASRGDEAIRKVEAEKPDLVLMDIRIEGPQDGIEVAEYIYAHFDVPVSYLTAYADKPTLERAKATLPFGYTLKPFEARALETVIELAIYRHKMERVLSEMEGWHALALNGMKDAVIGLDLDLNVTFMNKAAEEMSGYLLSAAFGKPFSDFFRTESRIPGFSIKESLQNPPDKESSAVILTKNRGDLPVRYTASPISGRKGEDLGFLLALKQGSLLERKDGIQMSFPLS